MRMFARVQWGGASNDGLTITPIFSVFAGYFFGNFRDKASIMIQLYTVPRRLFTDPKMYDLE